MARGWLSKSFVCPALKPWKREKRCVCSEHGWSGLKRNWQILWKLVPTWRRLSHENILSFRGVNTTLFPLALVYDWGEKGNINQHIASDPGASRLALVRNGPVYAGTATKY